MDINWLGHSCFRIKGKEVVVVTDPCHPSIGYTIGKVRADIVTVSHAHPGHSYTEAIEGEFREAHRPGEYELMETVITGIATYHDDSRGQERGKNVSFVIEVDGVTLCHLGDVGHSPVTELKEDVGDLGILFIPVGGASTITGATAAEIVRRLSPKIVIPMHYKTPAISWELDPVDRFLKELGVTNVVPQSKLTTNKINLPSNTQVVVFEYPG